MARVTTNPVIHTTLPLGRVAHRDCIPFMAEQPEECVDLVFADCPFNIGYGYDIYDDARSYTDYMNWSRRWMSEVKQILKPGGAFWLYIGDEYAADLKVAAVRDLGFHMVSWVVHYYTFGQHSSKKLTRSHAHLFYFTKGKQAAVFNADSIKIPSARQRIYGDKRAKAGGRVPDDLWILSPKNLPDAFCSGEDTWSVSRVCGTFNERVGTPNQLPEQLLGRVITLCSDPGDIVFDPFAGSGTTLAVAKKLSRLYFGCELSPDYTEIANQRLASINVGDALAGPVPQGN